MEHLDDLEDRPSFLNTEDWIVHNGGWLSGLSQIEKPFWLKIKTLYKGNPVQADITIRLPEEYNYKTNARGLFSTCSLPTLREGTIILHWNDVFIQCNLSTISGLKKALIVDFSDFLASCLNIERENRNCILEVSNKGKDMTKIHVHFKPVAVKLCKDEFEDTLESGETKKFTVSYLPTDENKIQPFYVYAEIAGNYSNTVCEIDWKE